jgi:2-aminoadipate transaminase
MDFPVARRMDDITASDVRELLKVTEHPEIISLAGGLPAPELFPAAKLAELARDLLREDGARALQYATTEGFRPLRRWVAQRMTSVWGARFTDEEVMVTTGSQQGLDLTAKLFLDEGDVVFCESPTYLAALGSFRVCRPRFVEIPTDDEGMDIEALQRALAQHHPKLVYVIPYSQNPSGRTWSLQRRREFMAVMADHPVPVIEDDAYLEVSFDGEVVPSLRTFDDRGAVVCLGTFSKVLSPGIRVGWVAAERPLLSRYILLKQSADLHTASLTQMLVMRWLESGALDPHLRVIRDTYRERRDAMLRALEDEMPAGTRFTRPRGGLFVWVELPGGVDARELLRRSLTRQVAFVPGGSFFPNEQRRNTARLNFSNVSPERIREAVRRIAAELRGMMREDVHGAEDKESTKGTGGRRLRKVRSV